MYIPLNSLESFVSDRSCAYQEQVSGEQAINMIKIFFLPQSLYPGHLFNLISMIFLCFSVLMTFLCHIQASVSVNFIYTDLCDEYRHFISAVG